MKRLMTSAATVLVLTGSAWGAAHTGGAFTQYESDEAVELFASDLLGARIYATEDEVDGTMEPGSETEWDDLGEINDIIMNNDGSVQVVILGIGGFLGIGERDVAVQFSELNILRDGEDPTDYFLVVNASQADIEAAPEYMRSSDEMMMGEGEVEAGMENTEAAAEDAAADTGRAVENAGEEMENSAEEAGQAVENTAEDAGQAMENMGDEAEAEVEENTTETNSQ